MSTSFASAPASFGARRHTYATACGSICGKTILSPREGSRDAADLESLPRLPRDEDGPVFAEPWQAQAFALAVRLSEEGHFTWTEWTEALGAQLQAAADRGEPDDGSRYYEHWLAALEGLVTEKKLTDAAKLSERKQAWTQAYRATPHGEPVKLERPSS
ncbi:MAG: nitrile hydratase accessory protein [Gammaproteobacteria bacterium]|nr:nitrile hydratase accessory protein [Gammaproteobacteria bacterium]